jgi:hypothetical protein
MVKLDVKHAEVGDLAVQHVMNGRHVEFLLQWKNGWNRLASRGGRRTVPG